MNSETAIVRDISTVSARTSRHMPLSDYQRERDRIRSLYGDNNKEALGLRDQMLAELFFRSGWTQEELAKQEGCTRQSAAYRLRFGRFLNFATTVAIPKNLTERRFRGYWEATDKAETNERIRFGQVQRLIERDVRIYKPNVPRKELGNAIVKQFADSQWHKLPTIVSRVKATEEEVDAVLETMRHKGTYRTQCERKKIGASWAYKIVRHDNRMIALEVLMQDLGPIIEGLEAEGKKNMATASPGTVAHLAHQLKALIERLAK